GAAPPQLRPSDLLGRRVSSSAQAKKASRPNDPRVDFRIFMNEGEPSVSTDRLGLAADAIIAAIADSEIPAGTNRSFYGWAALTVQAAHRNGRRVQATPRERNPYHVDIHLPEAAITDSEERKAHALELAANSAWR